jgi:hypothetical protein
MKLPEFDRSRMRWDEYKRFHVKRSNWFVQFETGEFIITTDTFKPDERRIIPGTDLRVVTPADSDCPQLYFDPKAPDRAETESALRIAGYSPEKLYTKAIPRAWLHTGYSPTLLVDETTGRVVRLYNPAIHKHAGWSSIPAWVRAGGGHYSRAVAYLPGHDSPAIASRLQIRYPYRPDKDEREALASLRAGCVAWRNMLTVEERIIAPDFYVHSWRDRHRYKYQRPCEPKTLPGGMRTKLQDLKPEQILQIALFGFAPTLCDTYLDHVTTNHKE